MFKVPNLEGGRGRERNFGATEGTRIKLNVLKKIEGVS